MEPTPLKWVQDDTHGMIRKAGFEIGIGEMGRRLEVVVIADDLTGAADTGVQFCPYFGTTILMPHDRLLAGALQDFGFPIQALAVYTNSRSPAVDLAKRRLGRVAAKIFALGAKRVYKKVDSCLRGNIGAEVDAIMQHMGYDLSLIAPAFPDMGRTTLHDIHLVNGIAVAKTELARDPVNPVKESRLSRVVSAGSFHKVGHVDLRFVDGTEKGLAEEVARLYHRGARHLVFDTVNQTHLDKIAQLGLAWPKKVLLVGSAGLAKSFARAFSRQPLPVKYDSGTVPAGNHLLVCGSAAERTKVQLSVLKKIYPYEVMSLSPHSLVDSAARDDLLFNVRQAQSILSKHHLIIRIGDEGMQRNQKPEVVKPWSAEEIVRGLGGFVAMVLRKMKPATLFLTGGDTASAVLESIAIKGVRLLGEIVPGVVHGRITGGAANGLSVVTKAGAFGNEKTLTALHEYWEST